MFAQQVYMRATGAEKLQRQVNGLLCAS